MGPAKAKKLSVWAVAKYACLGVPISVRYLDRPWKEVLTPRFPLLFPILVWLVTALVGFVVGVFRLDLLQSKYWVGAITSRAYYCLATSLVSYFLIAVVSNLFLFAWCALLLWLAKTKGSNIRVLRGAQRITYFAAFFQSIFFVLVAVFPIFYKPTGELALGAALPWLIVFVTAVIRILAVFQGIRRETSGNIFVAVLSIIGCIDVWLWLYVVFMGWVSCAAIRY